MGQTRRLAERMNLAAMTPSRDLASSGYCLANPGKEYLVYLPKGAAVTVDLTAASGTIMVQWVHPIEGTVTAGEPITGGTRHVFTSPLDGAAVLHLKSRQSRKEGE
jgi:hypothetical protein